MGKKNFRSNKTRSNIKNDAMWCAGRNGNSFDWYDSGILVYDSARIPFENVVGFIGNSEYTVDNNTTYSGYANIGAVMKVSFVPSTGVSLDANSTLNAAATKVYTFMVSAGSVGASFEANDVMITMLAIGACYAFLAEMRRAYGLISFVVPENRMIGPKCLSLLGYNADNLTNNKADFLKYINNFAEKLRTLKVPADFTFVKKWFWINDNVWVDRESPKSQAYISQFSHYFKYFPVAFASGGAVLLQSYEAITNKTIDQIESFGNDLLNQIINDKDVNDINSYVKRAYGDGQILIVPDTPTDHKITPKYDLEVLSEFHNLNTVGVPGSVTAYPDSDNGVTQVIPTGSESPYLFHRPHSGWQQYLRIPSSGSLFDVYTDAPSEKDVMVATRWMTLCKTVTAGTAKIQLVRTCGTEYATKIQVNFFGSSEIAMQEDTNTTYTHVIVNASGDYDPTTRLYDVAMVSTFDYAPIFISHIDENDEALIHSDLQNYTTISFRTLQGLHNAAITRELGVSQKVKAANDVSK